MKLTEAQLKQMIEEEIDQMIEEGWLDRLRSRTSGAGQTVGAIGKRIKGIGQFALGGDPEQADIGAAYGAGKGQKIIVLHQRKLRKALDRSAQTIKALKEDFQQDLEKLGLFNTPGSDPTGAELKNAIYNDLIVELDVLIAALSPKGPAYEILTSFSEAAEDAIAPAAPASRRH